MQYFIRSFLTLLLIHTDVRCPSSAAGDAVQHSSLVGNVTPTIEETREDIMAGLMKCESGFRIETVRLKVILTTVLFLFHLSQTSGKQ